MHNNLWVLQLLSPQRFDDPSFGHDLLQTLVVELPDFRPLRFGETEPLRHTWSDRLIERADAIWPAGPRPFMFEGREGRWGFVASISGNHIHSTLLLRAADPYPDDAPALEFFTAVAAKVRADFGLIHVVTETEAKRATARGLLPVSDGEGLFMVTSHHLLLGIPDIYWVTLFGSKYVEILGRASFASLPTGDALFVGEDLVIVKAVAESREIIRQPDRFDEARRGIIEHLGPDAFVDVQRRGSRRRVPVFDDSIARSLRRHDDVATELRRRAGLE